jgi:hypothetical protein
MLVLSSRDSVDRRAVLAACNAVGQPVAAMASWRAPQALRGREDVRLYAEALFAEVVAGQLGLALLVPPEDWLLRLPRERLGRAVWATTPVAVRRFPVFVKGFEDKLDGFRSGVYDRLPEDAPRRLLAADVVPIEVELRLFCLDGRVVAGSGYWRDGAEWQVELEATGLAGEARALVDAVWSDALPRACVIDVARVHGRLVVLEANAAWGASLYASDARAALPCLLAATLPRAAAAGLPPDTVRCPSGDA